MQAGRSGSGHSVFYQLRTLQTAVQHCELITLYAGNVIHYIVVDWTTAPRLVKNVWNMGYRPRKLARSLPYPKKILVKLPCILLILENKLKQMKDKNSRSEVWTIYPLIPDFSTRDWESWDQNLDILYWNQYKTGLSSRRKSCFLAFSVKCPRKHFKGLPSIVSTSVSSIYQRWIVNVLGDT